MADKNKTSKTVNNSPETIRKSNTPTQQRSNTPNPKPTTPPPPPDKKE